MRRPKPRQVRSTVAAAGCAKGYASAMPSLTIRMRSGEVAPDTLQHYIDAATAGTTLDLRGWSFTAGATVNKALTILGGTVTTGADTTALTITADDVTIDGMTLTGPQHENIYSGGVELDEYAVLIASARSNITIRNCVISNYGHSALWLDRVANLYVGHNTISDIGYTAIMVLSGDGGTIEYNTISRIGESFYTGGNRGTQGPDIWNNAYGIALSALRNPEIPSSDIVVTHNAVYDVTPWHAYDTHGGVDITWTDNLSVNSCSGFYMPGAVRTIINGNRVEQYTPPGEGGGSPFAAVFITTTDCTCTNNEFSESYTDYGDYPLPGDDRVSNYEGGNTGLTVSGNSLISP